MSVTSSFDMDCDKICDVTHVVATQLSVFSSSIVVNFVLRRRNWRIFVNILHTNEGSFVNYVMQENEFF